MKLFRSTCDANINNDIHDEDEDGVGGGYPVVSTRLLSSSSLFAYLDRKLGHRGNTRCHMMKKMMMRMIYKNLLRHRSLVFFHSTITKCLSMSFTSHLQLNMFLFPRALPHIRWGPQPGNRDTESTRGLSAIWGDFVSSNFQSEKFLASTKTQYLKMIILRDCRVVRDPQTLKSKGYGFVSFMKKVRNE